MLFGGAAALPEGVIKLAPVISVSALTYGDYEYTVLDDGTVEISRYSGEDTEVTIPATIDGKKVTSIGEHAFDYCIDITGITVPEGVTSIEGRAFSECYSLKNINLPDSLTSIGSLAFQLCGVDSLTIPDNVTSIGKDAFWNCSNLISVKLSDNLVSIGDSAFGNCTSLESIDIPIYVTSIGKEAFWNCKSLTSVTIPRLVEAIGEKAFGYNYENHGIESKADGFTIYGYKGTPAETYAANNGFTFIPLDATPGNVNGDGKVNIKDVMLIQQAIVGWKVTLL